MSLLTPGLVLRRCCHPARPAAALRRPPPHRPSGPSPRPVCPAHARCAQPMLGALSPCSVCPAHARCAQPTLGVPSPRPVCPAHAWSASANPAPAHPVSCLARPRRTRRARPTHAVAARVTSSSPVPLSGLARPRGNAGRPAAPAARWGARPGTRGRGPVRKPRRRPTGIGDAGYPAAATWATGERRRVGRGPVRGGLRRRC